MSRWVTLLPNVLRHVLPFGTVLELGRVPIVCKAWSLACQHNYDEVCRRVFVTNYGPEPQIQSQGQWKQELELRARCETNWRKGKFRRTVWDVPDSTTVLTLTPTHLVTVKVDTPLMQWFEFRSLANPSSVEARHLVPCVEPLRTLSDFNMDQIMLRSDGHLLFLGFSDTGVFVFDLDPKTGIMTCHPLLYPREEVQGWSMKFDRLALLTLPQSSLVSSELSVFCLRTFERLWRRSLANKGPVKRVLCKSGGETAVWFGKTSRGHDRIRIVSLKGDLGRWITWPQETSAFAMRRGLSGLSAAAKQKFVVCADPATKVTHIRMQMQFDVYSWVERSDHKWVVFRDISARGALLLVHESGSARNIWGQMSSNSDCFSTWRTIVLVSSRFRRCELLDFS